MSFNPPPTPADGTQYTYGNLVWEFSSDTGTWNILDGSVVGGVGPQGEVGPAGPTGATGGAITGDNSAFIVYPTGVGSVRVGGVGTTGVVGFGGRFDSANGIASHKLASTSLTGIASFRNTHFLVDATGHVQLANSGFTVTDQNGYKNSVPLGGDVVLTGGQGIYVSSNNTSNPTVTIYGVTADTSGTLGVSYFNSGFFVVRDDGRVSLAAAYQVTGDTIAAGSAINFSTSGRTKTLNNIGVTSFNGATGTINFTVPLAGATSGVTGTASFNANRFQVSATGNVDLVAAYQVTGDTVVTVAGSGIGIATSGRTDTLYNLGVVSINGVTGSMSITGNRHGVAFFDPAVTAAGLSANSTFLYNGNSLTFGSNTSTFTVTGPNMVLGAATQITGGIFKNPAEAAPFFNLGSNNTLVINGASGSIQRFSITPTARVTIRAGSAWHDFTTATETIAVIVQNNSNMTGAFDSSILVDGGGAPSLFGKDTSAAIGVTGGISVFTLMRVNKGSNTGLTMGFVISTGMTGPTVTIN